MTGNRPLIAAGLAFAVLVVGWIHPGAAAAPPSGTSIDPANFTTRIDNPFFPLKRNATFNYTGTVAEGTEDDTVEVTKQTREVMGVTCVVVQDTAFVNGAIAELTFDFFAEDNQGNVWYFGEDSKKFSGGVVVSTEGSWEAGVNGALPGIIMEAHPQVGDVYQQENAKHVAEDRAEVLSTNETVTVPFGTFTGCLLTKEFSRLDKKVVEHKWYAPGVGFVKSLMVQGGNETSELVKATGF